MLNCMNLSMEVDWNHMSYLLFWKSLSLFSYSIWIEEYATVLQLQYCVIMYLRFTFTMEWEDEECKMQDGVCC